MADLEALILVCMFVCFTPTLPPCPPYPSLPDFVLCLVSGVPKPGFPKPSFPFFLFGFFQCFRRMLLLAPNKDSPTKLQSERKPQPAPVAHVMWPNSKRDNDGTETKKRNKKRKTRNKKRKIRKCRRNKNGKYRTKKRKIRNVTFPKSHKNFQCFGRLPRYLRGYRGTSERYRSSTPVRPWCTRGQTHPDIAKERSHTPREGGH